jgi:LuxR family maltose regulon positive regulatory protein
MLSIPESKIAVPALPDLFLPRPRLLAALSHGDEPGEDSVTLVCAPSGFGKTALLSQWAHATADTRRGTGVAWLDLDSGDDDPRRLWQGVLAALAACPAVPPDSTLHELARVAPRADPNEPEFLDDLIEALDALPVPVPLVLHDVHEIVAPAALRALQAIVAARPAGVRILLCSRLDPPLPLDALRAAGVLRELRADRLRFSPEESGGVLRGFALRLTPAQVAAVHTRTGGQPAGLCLTGAVLRSNPDVDAFLARFAGTDRPVPDFLVAEVLDALPVGDREILTAVSIDESLAGSLATVLPDRIDAGPVLDRLASEMGLVTRTGTAGDRYRLNPLLAAYLRAERAHRPQVAADLHARAARWWAAHDDAVPAVGHATRTGDDALLIDLVHRFTGALLVRGEHQVLRDALQPFGDPTTADDPWLALCLALADIEAGDPAATQAALERARRLWPAEPEHRLSILRSMTEVFAAAATADLGAVPTRPGPDRGGRHVDQSPEWVALALVSIGGAGMLADGDRAAAQATLHEAFDLAQRHQFGYLKMQCLALLAGVAGVAGDYPRMATAAQRAVAAAADGGWEATLWPNAGRWMLGYAALLRAEPAEALRHTAEALQRSTALPPRMRFALRSLHGAALFDSGRRPWGLQEMQQARIDLGAVSLTGEQAAALAVLEHRAALTLNLPDDAGTVVDWLAKCIGPHAEALLMTAWANLSSGSHSAARAAVGPLLNGSVPAVLPHTVVEALLVEATAGVRRGEVQAARAALRTALSVAKPLDVLRPFATAESPARALLDRQLHQSAAPDPFTARALATARQAGHMRGGRLTTAEREALRYLPTPLTVAQIAAQLGIGPSEAQALIRGIYRKLGASSRRTAVAAGRARRFLH